MNGMLIISLSCAGMALPVAFASWVMGRIAGQAERSSSGADAAPAQSLAVPH